MDDIRGKKLLVLGGTASVKDVLLYAKELGLYTVVTASGEIAEGIMEMCDEAVHISTSDTNQLAKYIVSNNVSGVMTGASEFNIKQCIKLSEKTGINFYASQKQWDLLSNKKRFKNLCKRYKVPTIRQFDTDKPEEFQYPIIVKPVDACSARGISICYDNDEYNKARKWALKYSEDKEIIVEQYIENNGMTVSARYIVIEGKIYLQVVGDRWVVEPIYGGAPITWASQYPSRYTEDYIEHIDDAVKNMFISEKLRNGCFFLEALPTSEGIFLYEMGYRISGGMTYKITEKLTGVNELKMLLCHTITGKMCDERTIPQIDPFLNGGGACVLCVPLKTGKISKIDGLAHIRKISEVYDIKQYCHVGDRIDDDVMGTLDQLFARITVISDEAERTCKVIKQINSVLSIKDENDEEMYIQRFAPELLSHDG